MSIVLWANLFKFALKMEKYMLDKRHVDYKVVAALDNPEKAEEETDLHI